MTKKRYWRGKRSYIDDNAERIAREAEAEVPFIDECLTEQELVEMVKAWNPNITPEELKEAIRLSCAAKTERARAH
jgi:hypothetical protein